MRHIVSNRPLATVTPRESSSQHRSQEKKDRERYKEKEKKKDKENELENKAESSQSPNSIKSSRKTTVNLPSESNSARGVKVHAVSPLYSNVMIDITSDKPVEIIMQRPEPIAPLPERREEEPIDQVLPNGEFSYSALEAMAMLKQRIASPVPVFPSSPPPLVKIEAKVHLENIPLDLSESLAKDERTNRVEEEHPIAQRFEYPFPFPAQIVQEIDGQPVRSLLDRRAEFLKLKKEKSKKTDAPINGTSDTEDIDDIDEEIAELTLSLTDASFRRDDSSAVSAEQQNFLFMFGLITLDKKSGTYTLHTCSPMS